MGLDMYLEARKYVSKSNWKDGEPSPNPDYSSLVALAPEGLTDKAHFGSASVVLPVGYWRKANAIHGWFVNNLADGVDECQEIYVPRDALVNLREACKSVMSVSAGVSKENVADEVGLTPTQGFFFGSYEIDEYYMQDLKDTVDIIDTVLTIISEDNWDWSFYYRASW